MNNNVRYYKKLILLLGILFGIFSLGSSTQPLYTSSIEATYNNKDNHHEVNHFISPVVERISIASTKENEARDEKLIFYIIRHHRYPVFKSLLYISLGGVIGFISVRRKIIEYIHDKDGPKGKISLANIS